MSAKAKPLTLVAIKKRDAEYNNGHAYQAPDRKAMADRTYLLSLVERMRPYVEMASGIPMPEPQWSRMRALLEELR